MIVQLVEGGASNADTGLIVDNTAIECEKEGDVARFEWRTRAPQPAGTYVLKVLHPNGQVLASHEFRVEPSTK